MIYILLLKAQMVRKVQAYLRNIDDKIIEDEAKLQELSEKCEHPPNYMQSHSTPTTQVYISLEHIICMALEIH